MSKNSDQYSSVMACFSFLQSGTCSWGERCKFLHQAAQILEQSEQDNTTSLKLDTKQTKLKKKVKKAHSTNDSDSATTIQKFLITNIDLKSNGYGLARLIREKLSPFGKDLKIYVEKTHPHRRIRNGTVEAVMAIDVILPTDFMDMLSSIMSVRCQKKHV